MSGHVGRRLGERSFVDTNLASPVQVGVPLLMPPRERYSRNINDAFWYRITLSPEYPYMKDVKWMSNR